MFYVVVYLLNRSLMGFVGIELRQAVEVSAFIARNLFFMVSLVTIGKYLQN